MRKTPLEIDCLKEQVKALWTLEEGYHICGYDPDTPLYAEFTAGSLEASARLLMKLGDHDLARDHLRTEALIAELGGTGISDWTLCETDSATLARLAQWYFDFDGDLIHSRIARCAGLAR